MKRKIFSKLLMGALLVASVSLYVSCKDYDDDIKDLQAQIDSLNGTVTQKETAIKSLITDLDNAYQKADADLKKAMEEADAAIKKAYADADAILKGQLQEKFQEADAQLKKDYEAGDVATLAAAKTAIQEAKDALQKTIDENYKSLNDKNIAQDEAIAKAQADATAALNALPLKADKTDLEAAVKRITDLETKCAALDKDLKQAIKDIETLQTTVKAQGEAIKAVQELANKNAGLISQNAKDIAENKKNIKINADDIDKLEADLKALDTKLATTKTELEGKIAEAAKKAADDLAAAKTELNKNIADAKEEVLSKITTEISGVKTQITDLRTELINRANTIDVKYDVITSMLAEALRSLVYMPYLYVDGIESIEYPYLVDTALALAPAEVITRQRVVKGFEEDYVKTIRDAASTTFPKLAPLRDWVVKTPIDIEWFGPSWPVEYHMNPSISTTAWKDIKGWNRRNAEIITRSTTGEKGNIHVSEKYADGTQLFSNKNGVLTVGIQIDEPQYLAYQQWPTEWFDGRPGNVWERYATVKDDKSISKDYQFDDMIALQAYSSQSDKDTIITSDYAMVFPERVYPEAIVWTKYHSKKGFKTVEFDEQCPWEADQDNEPHVWDSPKKALGFGEDCKIYPDIELYYNDTKGICLKDYLGIHMIYEAPTLKGLNNPKTIEFNDAKFGQFGLSYQFQLVGYSIDGNKTIDSNYAEFTDANDKGISLTGTIRARNVKEDGQTIDTESATSVDREPLVRVLVMRGDRVILDGYILIHITRNAPQEEQLVVDNYPEQDATFDLCNDEAVFTTNWSQFSYYVLTQKLDNMTKEAFDAQYGQDYPGVPDLMGTVEPCYLTDTPEQLKDNSMRFDDVQLFEDTKGTKSKASNLPGYVSYYHNSVGTTNHRFEWVVTADELEAYTHDRADLPRKITKYFRYTGKAGAKYEYIYVKMTFNLDRAKVANAGITDKNTQYWFKYTGNDEGWDAVVWNPWYPQDYGNTKTFRQNLVSTFAKNYVNFTKTAGLAKGWKANINASIAEAKPGVNIGTQDEIVIAEGTKDAQTALAKFYFTPYEFEITTQKGVKYTITARNAWNAEDWNSFVCRYVGWNDDGADPVVHGYIYDNYDAEQYSFQTPWQVVDEKGKSTIEKGQTFANLHAANGKTYTTHKWGTPAQNKEILEKCAIDYRLGVFANKTLYAVKTADYKKSGAVYTPIATLNQNIGSGAMQLIWRTPDDDVTKEVLNAVGYEDDVHSNILKELNCMVGVIAHNGCDVAVSIDEYVKDEDNNNAGTFYVSWQRPINVVTEATPMVDAKDNGDYIYLVDFLKMFDWRGPEKGYMWGDKQWLWAYYNVKSLTIDVTPEKVLTNMHQAADKFVKLSDVTTMAQLGVLNPDGSVNFRSKTKIDLNLQPYNYEGANANLLAAMGIKPVSEAKKLLFGGGLFYANNGDNVTDFDVKVPVTVAYDWGEFVAVVTVHIHRTLGN